MNQTLAAVALRTTAVGIVLTVVLAGCSSSSVSRSANGASFEVSASGAVSAQVADSPPSVGKGSGPVTKYHAVVAPALGTAPAEGNPWVNPGSTAAGRPTWGTGQNLPPLTATVPYFVGPGFATEVKAYYDSGKALRQQAKIATSAFDWVKERIDNQCDGNPRSCKATVVFDVDETLLSNYEFYKGTDFTFDQDGWNAFNEACMSTPIVPVRRLYNRLRTSGIRVVIMTGRAEATRSWTQACLEQHGITDWDKLILRSPGETGLSADAYKSGERAALQRAGYRIFASIGDQVSDMSSGSLMAGFLLPNAMYFIP